MKLIKPYFEIIEQEPGLKGIYKQIEHTGRVSYKSEDRITEDSAKPFVDMLIKKGHTAVLEQGTVYLDITGVDIITSYNFYNTNPYSKIYKNTLEESWDEPHLYVTTNYRVIIQHGKLYDLKFLCEPTKYHEKRVAVRFVTSRSIANEFVRHRVFSFIQESTRYCNYGSDKFNNELTFIIPCWSKATQGNYGTLREPAEIQFDEYDEDVFEMEFINELINIEFRYMNILSAGYTPQQAREVLPLATKTELIMTGFISDWEHFFGLRCDKAAHPQAQELAIPLKEEFIKRGYLKN